MNGTSASNSFSTNGTGIPLQDMGSFLRERREAMGVTLAEVEAATRIRQKYLAALESDEWNLLPGEIVGRGFLRNYSLYLDLEPNEILERRRAVIEPRLASALDYTSAGSSLPPIRNVDYRPKEVDLKDEPDGIEQPGNRLASILFFLVSIGALVAIVVLASNFSETPINLLNSAQTRVALILDSAQASTQDTLPGASDTSFAVVTATPISNIDGEPLVQPSGGTGNLGTGSTGTGSTGAGSAGTGSTGSNDGGTTGVAGSVAGGAGNNNNGNSNAGAAVVNTPAPANQAAIILIPTSTPVSQNNAPEEPTPTDVPPPVEEPPVEEPPVEEPTNVPPTNTPLPPPTNTPLPPPTPVPLIPTNTPIPPTPVPLIPTPTPIPPTPVPLIPTNTPAPPPIVQAPCPDPRSVITSPGVNQVLSGVVPVTGNATHEIFQYYKLEYAVGSNASGGFVYFDGRESPVAGGLLGNFNSAALPNGAYTLRVSVVDQTGNFPPPCDVSVTVAN
ncbi:MAG: helix-turn-helix domain-containing protein [Chloroflexota bacterium]